MNRTRAETCNASTGAALSSIYQDSASPDEISRGLPAVSTSSADATDHTVSPLARGTVVELRGVEPLASSMRPRRSSQLSYSPEGMDKLSSGNCNCALTSGAGEHPTDG